MATFRKIHISFWTDTFVQDLTPEQKYFYLYLMTNSCTTQCGIYEISKRQMVHDTGYNVDTVNKLLEFFRKAGKVRYSEDTSELALKNWPKYNSSRSPKVQLLINEELKSIKDRVLIEYVYSIDTVSAIEEEKEEEKEEEENKIHPLQNSNLFRKPNTPEWDAVHMFFVQSGGTEEMARKFFDKWEGVGWYANGSPIINFAPLANSYIASWRQNENKTKPKGKERWH